MREAGRGLLFGLVLGYATFLLLRSVDDYQVEVLSTLAAVTGGYALASRLHVSGPLAMVVAGLMTAIAVARWQCRTRPAATSTCSGN